MKRIAFIYSLLAALFLSSCSKDDSPAPGHEQTSFNVSFTGIDVRAGYDVKPPNQSLQLTSVLSNRDKASYVKGAETLMGSSNITIQGISSSTALRSVTVNVVEGSAIVYSYNVNLGLDITDKTLKDDTNSCTSFLSNIATYIATKKSLTIQIVLNGGDTDISNMTITVHVAAIFSW